MSSKLNRWRSGVSARAVMIATGAKYRENWLRRESFTVWKVLESITVQSFIEELQLCKDEEVSVVGGGNLAGQAAGVFWLKAQSSMFSVVVRSDGLADTMSRYLIRRIEETPNITVLPHTWKLSRSMAPNTLGVVTWRNGQSGETIEKSIAHLFVMTGAIPGTPRGWRAVSCWMCKRIHQDRF